MPPKNPVNWMLSDAIESLARAERMHQRLFTCNRRPNVESRAGSPPSTSSRPKTNF